MESLQQERNQLMFDLWEGKRPKRVPVTAGVSLEYALQYKGYSLLRELYSPRHCFEVAEEMAKLINTDNLPTAPETRAAIFRYSMNKFMTPGRDGFFQHPNFSPMKVEEYPELIKDPFAYWTKVIRPRFLGIIAEDKEYGHLRLEMAHRVVDAKYAGMGSPELIEKYERINNQVIVLLTMTPFDCIADYFRNFTGILIDIRKNPGWVLEACEAMLGFLDGSLKRIKKTPEKLNLVSLPLHMPPFMKPKDYEKFYFPTFQKLIQMIQDYGLQPTIYCEENWDPHLDSLNDLPGRVLIGFEKSNPKLVMEKLNKRHIMRNFFDAHMLRTATPDQVRDEVKKLLDIVAVNGNYIFAPSKQPLYLSDAKIENIIAMVEAVLEYGVY